MSLLFVNPPTAEFPAQQFKDLIDYPKGLCVSIFMPNYACKPKQIARFNNLMRQAEELLEANRRGPAFALQFLQPASFLSRNARFWQQPSQGIAVFLAAGICRYYHLPIIFEELVVVTDRFHLEPLCPLISRDELCLKAPA